jgi:putative hydrolase of the HAD superfamily
LGAAGKSDSQLLHPNGVSTPEAALAESLSLAVALDHMIPRAVFFDVYGTLLEVGPPPADGEARWQQLLHEFLPGEPSLSRLDLSLATASVIGRHHAAARDRGIAWPEVYWPAVVAEVLPSLARLTPELQEELLWRQIQTGHTTVLRSAAADLLRGLEERACVLGIVSSAQAYSERELARGLAPHGLDLRLFASDLRFWSYQHGFSKPDPHVFQLLTARLAARGIAPDEALMIGDHAENDMAPARAHGWRTWHLGVGKDGDWADLQAWLTSASPPF